MAGSVTLILAALAVETSAIPHPGIFLAFTAALALSWAFPLLMFREEETEALQLDEAFLVAMAILLSPFEIVLAFAFGVVAGQLARRRPIIKAIFNIGQSTAAAGAAVFVMHLAGDPGEPMGAQDLLALVAGAGTFLAVQSAFVSGIIALIERRSFKSAFLDGLGARLIVWIGNVSAGLLAGLVGHAYPWSLTFAIVPMAVLHLAFAGHLQARRDRERMNGLFQTAQKAHASMGIGDVEQSIAESARILLRCDHARFDLAPPKQSELGACFSPPGEDDRWLIVSDRRGVEPFDAADQNLLEAIVAIGAAALENASLYQQARDEREKLADVVGSSSDGIFSVDSQGRISSWNPAMEAITGFSADEMVGTRHLGALRPRDSEGHDVMINGWTKTGIKPPADLQILTTRGEIRWLSCTFSPLHEGGYVAVARDVTSQKQIDDLKADFLATVSHELRTPLTPIQGFLMTLLREDGEFPPEERQNFYRIMLGQSERLGRLVEDLLEAVSLQRDEHKFMAGEVNWRYAARELVDLMRRQHPDREFTFEEQGEVPNVSADEQRSEQVLANLLTNAVKYSPQGLPIHVTIEARGLEIVTTVTDHGPGIAPEDRERIFERFTRLGDHMTRPGSGVGLGLYIARRLVEGMNGRIWVEEASTEGAQFKFSLPRFHGETPAAARAVVGRNGRAQ